MRKLITNGNIAMAVIVLVGGTTTVAEIIRHLNETDTVVVDSLSDIELTPVTHGYNIDKVCVDESYAIKEEKSWQSMNRGNFSKKQRRAKF